MHKCEYSAFYLIFHFKFELCVSYILLCSFLNYLTFCKTIIVRLEYFFMQVIIILFRFQLTGW
jgi:hypothetical protein